MYTVLTTCPPYGSQNVGDKLIEHRVKELVQREKGDVEFVTIFREDPLDDQLDRVNESRAILLPALPVRDTPMYPKTYRLADDLSRIKPPLVPIGGNWNVYPGDAQSRRMLRYSDETVAFLRHVSEQVEHLSLREYHACEVLANHGITNTLMTGDPAWFDVPSMGKPMHRPREINGLAFTPPLSPHYVYQAEQIMRMLAAQFPDAKRYCAMHLTDAGAAKNAPDQRVENSAAMSPEVARKNQRVRELAGELGFELLELAGRLEGMTAYNELDLHVGYECHAHMYFVSRRRPTVLIAEDARGVGFNDTLGVGGFTGFQRAQSESVVERKTHTSGYCTTYSELSIAPPRLDVHEAVRQYLREELASGFRRYVGLAGYIDEIYEQVMRPFLQSLP